MNSLARLGSQQRPKSRGRARVVEGGRDDGGIDGILTSVNRLTGMDPFGQAECAPCTDHQGRPREHGRRPAWGGIHGNRWADGIKASANQSL
jgi:hypothetical protein